MPVPDTAESEFRDIKPVLERFINFLKTYNIFEQIYNIVETTPMLISPKELYNKTKSQKDDKILCEYLDYFDGKRSILASVPSLNKYFKDHFKFVINMSNFEIMNILNEYFQREYWEEKIQKSLQNNNYLFIYGSAGVGKTTIAARIAQIYNSDIFIYTSVKRSELKAINSLKRLYQSFRLRLGGLPPLSESLDLSEIKNYILFLGERIKAYKRSDEHIFVFDGIDEMPEDEFFYLIESIQLLRNIGIKLIFTSRNKLLGDMIQKALGFIDYIYLENLTEAEILEWFKRHNQHISSPSVELIKYIYKQTEGNFFFLKSIPVFSNENLYFDYLRNIPKNIIKIFDQILEKLETENELMRRVLALFIIIPSPCSRKLIKKTFNLDMKELNDIIRQLYPFVKEVSNDAYILFHSRFLEYLQDKLSKEIENLDIISNISRYEKDYISITDIPLLYNIKYTDLMNWIKSKIENIEDIISDKHRFDYISAITDSFLIINEKDPSLFLYNADILSKFIDHNFQVIVDWRIGLKLKKAILKKHFLNNLRDYQIIGLLIVSCLYNEKDYKKSLSYAATIKENFSKKDRNYIRCMNYIGLISGKLDLLDEAIKAYTEAINIATHTNDIIWLMYSKMNRGIIYLRKNKFEPAQEDILTAIKYREDIAYNNKIFYGNLKDIADEMQAKLTLCMGYENKLKLFRSKLSSTESSIIEETIQNLETLLFTLLHEKIGV